MLTNMLMLVGILLLVQDMHMGIELRILMILLVVIQLELNFLN